MSPQADYVVSNGTGAAVRSDINGQLAAIVSNNSGASAPATTYAYMLWADTSTNLLKLRNGANSAWITVGDLTAANLGLATLASPTFTGTATIPTLTVSTAANIPLGSAASPTLYFTGDSNTGLYSPGADQVALSTGGTGRLFIDSSGRCGIGTSVPVGKLAVGNSSNNFLVSIDSTASYAEIQAYNAPLYINRQGNNTILNSGGGSVGIGSTPSTQFSVQNTSTSLGIETDTTSGFASGPTIRGYYRPGSAYTTLALTGSQVVLGINDVEKARLDASGRLLVGTSTARSNINHRGTTGITPNVQFETATGSYNGGLSIINNSSAGYAATLTLGVSHGTTIGSNTLGSSGSQTGTISFSSSDGTNFIDCAQVRAEIDGTPGTNDMPGRLVFSTTADGASSPTERLRIANNGAWGLAGANYGSSGQVLTSNGSGAAPSWSTASSGAGTVQAWVNFNGTTGSPSTIRGSGNVSSVTKNGTGDYTVNFTTALVDANYGITLGYRRSGGGFGDQNMVCTAPTYGTTPATSNVRVGTTNAYDGGREDTDYISVAIIR